MANEILFDHREFFILLDELLTMEFPGELSGEYELLPIIEEKLNNLKKLYFQERIKQTWKRIENDLLDLRRIIDRLTNKPRINDETPNP